jgi:glycosyltransferase involved in cell wall biosynthesis
MLPHVCILSAAHPAWDGRVTHKIGKGLRSAGMRVSWIGPDLEAPVPGHGIEFNLLSPESGWMARYWRGRALLEAASRLSDVDIWFGVEPDSAAIAIKLAQRCGGRAVFDIHEMYHDDMLKGRVPTLLKPLLGAVMKWKLARICRGSDLIIGAGLTRVEPYQSAARTSMVVRHCLSGELAREPGATPFDGSRGFVRIIHGKATLSHGTRQIMEAAAYVRQHSGPKLRILMFKSFHPNEKFGLHEAMKLATDLGVADMIEWHEPVPFQNMFDLMRTCDLGVIAYTQEMGVSCMPNRIFEYMAFGIPVVCPVYARELVSILNETQCGILAQTETGESLGEAILAVSADREAAKEMGLRGRRAFVERFNMEQELQPFVDWVFADLARRSATKAAIA